MRHRLSCERCCANALELVANTHSYLPRDIQRQQALHKAEPETSVLIRACNSAKATSFIGTSRSLPPVTALFHLVRQVG